MAYRLTAEAPGTYPTKGGAPTGAPRTAGQLQAMYGFGAVVPDSEGGYVAYGVDEVSGKYAEIARFIPDAEGNLVQEGPRGARASAGTGGGGGGAAPPQGSYVTGPDGRVYYAAPYGGGLTEVGNLGMAPEWTPVQDQRTGKSRLFDPNTGKTIDLGQTSFAGIDPREVEGQRRFESDREYALRQAESAQSQAYQGRQLEMQERQFEASERQAEANRDLSNRQLGLQAANALTSLAESQEARKREILKGASDFVYRAFTQRGEAAPEERVTHSDLINNLSGEFDKIASIYAAAIQPKPLSSTGRLTKANPYLPTTTQNVPGAGADMVKSPSVSAAPGASPSLGGGGGAIQTAVPTYDENGNINGWGLPGGPNTTGPSIEQAPNPYMQPPAPAYTGGGGGGTFSGGGGGFTPAPAPVAPRMDPSQTVDWSTYEPVTDYGRYAQDGMDYPWTPPTTPPQPESYYTPLDKAVGSGLKKVGGAVVGGLRGIGKLLTYDEGGRLFPGQPAIVGEDGYEVIYTDPVTGETHVIPNEEAEQMVSKDGKVKAKGRLTLPGYDEGTSGYPYDPYAVLRADQRMQLGRVMQDPSQFFGVAGPVGRLNQFGGPMGEVLSKGSPGWRQDMQAIRRLMPREPQIPAPVGRLRGMLDRIPGFANGTDFFNGWDGQDAASQIMRFQQQNQPTAAAPGPAKFGTYGQGVYGGSGYLSQEAKDWEVNYARYGGKANNGGDDPWNDWMRDGRSSPSAPAYTAFDQLTQALRKGTTTQAALQADEKRLRPPAVDTILKGGEMATLRIPGLDGNPPPQIASRLALNKMTPDELTALNTSLGVAYNTTLDDYLAVSDQRFLAGQDQRRLRTQYR